MSENEKRWADDAADLAKRYSYSDNDFAMRSGVRLDQAIQALCLRVEAETIEGCAKVAEQFRWPCDNHAGAPSLIAAKIREEKP